MAMNESALHAILHNAPAQPNGLWFEGIRLCYPMATADGSDSLWLAMEKYWTIHNSSLRSHVILTHYIRSHLEM